MYSLVVEPRLLDDVLELLLEGRARDALLPRQRLELPAHEPPHLVDVAPHRPPAHLLDVR